MAAMEDRLRATLRERVQDVATQPALYRRVQERAERSRRRRRLRFVPAAAAAFGLIIGVPSLIEGGHEMPWIEDDAAPPPASATAPERVVTLDASGDLALLDLTDGTTERAFGSVDPSGAFPWLAVVPSDRSRAPAVVLGTPQDTPAGTLLRQHHYADGSVTITDHDPGDGATFAPSFDGGFALSPDGRWMATFTEAVEGDGYLTVQVRPTDQRASMAEGPETYLDDRTSFPPGSVLQDWTGSLDPRGGRSQLTVLVPDGGVVAMPLAHAGDEAYDQQRIEPEVYARSSFRTVASESGDFPVGRREVAAYASSHLSDDVDGGTAYVLAPDGDGTVVQAVDGERTLGQIDVTELIGDQEPSAVALDAWGDTATLATREGSWLLTHDGDGGFAEPIALPEGTVRAAPVGRDVDASGVAPIPGDPEHALLVLDDGTLVADDLASGERTELHPPVNPSMGVHSLTVSVGSTIDDFTAAGYDDGASGDLGLITYVRRDGGDVVSSLTPSEDLPGFASNRAPYAVAPDGRWVAYQGMAGPEAGGEPVIHLVPIDPRTAQLNVGEVRSLEVGDLWLQDWSGAVTEGGDRSRLVGSSGETTGFAELVLERTETGFVVAARNELTPAPPGDDVQGWAAFTSQRPGGDDDPRFELLRRWDGGGVTDAATLRYVAGDQVLAERTISFGERAGNLALAARGSTALIVTDFLHGPAAPMMGGRALVTGVVSTDDGGVELLLPRPLEDGPVTGALLGGLPSR